MSDISFGAHEFNIWLCSQRSRSFLFALNHFNIKIELLPHNWTGDCFLFIILSLRFNQFLFFILRFIYLYHYFFFLGIFVFFDDFVFSDTFLIFNQQFSLLNDRILYYRKTCISTLKVWRVWHVWRVLFANFQFLIWLRVLSI